MFILHRCHFCGDLCTQRQDGIYLCDDADCEAAHLFTMSKAADPLGF